MSKVAIVYKSKYGSTKQYAQILKEALNADLYESKNANVKELQNYDVIVFAGGLFASGIGGLSFLKQHFESLENKHLYLLAVGASQLTPNVLEEVKQRNAKEQLVNVPVYYARGKWDVTQLHFVDRQMCKVLYKALAKKDFDKLSVYDQEFFERYHQKSDWVSKEQVASLIEDIKKTLQI